MSSNLKQKILQQIQEDSKSGCWNWTGQVSNSGYGKLMIKDEYNLTRYDGAAEVSYRAFVGPVEKGYYIRSRCGNRLCVNPEHLELFKPCT